MANETIRLAEYAAHLRYDDLPAHVIERAKDCITDTVAVIVTFWPTVEGFGVEVSLVVVAAGV